RSIYSSPSIPTPAPDTSARYIQLREDPARRCRCPRCCIWGNCYVCHSVRSFLHKSGLLHRPKFAREHPPADGGRPLCAVTFDKATDKFAKAIANSSSSYAANSHPGDRLVNEAVCGVPERPHPRSVENSLGQCPGGNVAISKG